MAQKIMSLHLDPDKMGVNIDQEKYQIIKNCIMKILEKGPRDFTSLSKKVKSQIDSFEGSVMWYFTTVKLDLEARGLIIVTRGGGRQLIKKK